MRRRIFWVALVLVIASSAFALLTPAQFQQDPGSGSGSSGDCPANCTYCCQDKCGCGSPEGWLFVGWCGCSSIECNRVCSWKPAG